MVDARSRGRVNQYLLKQLKRGSSYRQLKAPSVSKEESLPAGLHKPPGDYARGAGNHEDAAFADPSVSLNLL